MSADECLEFALGLARTAGDTIRKYFGSQTLNIEYKAAIDLVTSVDKEVEEYIRTAISQRFPTHTFLGEESSAGPEMLSEQPTWIVDPIDGTTNFVHGLPFVSVSIAFAVDKQIQCGVVHNPILNETFTAARGRGAFLNGQPIHVAQRESLGQAVVATNVGYDRTPDGIEFMADNVKILLQNNVRSLRSLGSSATELSWVACGRLDLFYEFGIHIWDIAAATLIVEEAGGVVCDPNGGSLNLVSRRVLGANRKLAESTAAVLNCKHPKHTP